MNSSSIPTESDVFLNVRKSYRLLHEYQHMVLDAVRYILSQFVIGSETGGVPTFANDTRANGYRFLQQPSWDWLPMMGYEFHFLTPCKDDPVGLSFFIFSDTGYFFGEDNTVDHKEILADYAAAEQSATIFAFILRKGPWKKLPFMQNKCQMRDFLKEGGCLPDNLIEDNHFGKSYDMSFLTSELKLNRIINDIMSIAGEKKWSISLKRQLAAHTTPL